jgi:hypothetical protein
MRAEISNVSAISLSGCVILFVVIAGLDPAIHGASHQGQSFCENFFAEVHHGCAGQARA